MLDPNGKKFRTTGLGTIDEPLIMWLVRPPFEDPIRLEGNEDVARQLSKERGMTHIWIRKADHDTTRMLTSEKIKQMLYRIPYPPKPEMDYVQKQQDYMVADSKPQPPQSSMVLTQVPLYGRADRQDSNAIRDKYGYLKEGKLLDSYRPTYRGRRDKSRHSRDRKLVNSYRSARGSLGSTSRAYSSPRSHPGPASSPRSGPRSLRSPPFPPSRRRKVFCGTSDVATMQGDVFLVASVTEKWRIMYDCECSYEPRKGIHLSFYPSEPGEITEQIPMELPY